MILPCYVVLHKFSKCNSRVKVQIPYGFPKKGPPHLARGKIKLWFLSFGENEGDENKSKDGTRKKTESDQV